ncbi:MAG: hypothetical protein LBL05_05315 [Synergistaceae bacterium]|jgi:uncharacterized protein YutE (UPF0331/DUF86 family)|nr:hypothetical protein [Synergistaceae bacterium]
MKELPDFVASELNLIKIPVSRIARLLRASSWDEDQTTAFGTYVQNVYAGIERILQYLLKERGEKIPKSPMWHYDLLKTSYIFGLVPSEIQPALENLMKYRHRHVHGYGHMLDELKLRELAAPISDVFELFDKHVTDLYKISS